MDSSWEGYRGGCDPTPANNEQKLEEHEVRLDKLEKCCVALQAQLETLQSTLDAVNEKCSTIVERVEWDNLNDLFKGPVPLDVVNNKSCWSPEERCEIRKTAESVNTWEHERCAFCGEEVCVGAAWMWGGKNGATKPYFARCSKSGCRNVRPLFGGDTPEEALQQWDERQKAIKAELNRR